MQILKHIASVAVLGLGYASALAQTDSAFIVPGSTKPHMTAGKKTFHSNYLIFNGVWKHRSMDDVLQTGIEHGPQTSTIAGYHPSDILSAYSIPANSGTQAIAVIDAFDLPTNLSDFNTFSKEFGLPTESSTVATASTNKVFQVVYGSGSKPASNGDWGGEIAIDMEWAHAIAPKAKIYLVECASDNESDLFAGVQYVNEHLPDVGVISMSFGGNEDSSETQIDPIFTAPNVVYLAASGDEPNTVSYPATSPNVIAVGGTTLNLSSGSVTSETYWYQDSQDGGAAGLSTIEPIPSYQSSLSSLLGKFRGTNDLAADADPSTGCAIYDSTPIPTDHNASGWLVFGGTSLACPICAGILDARGYLQPTSFAELTQLYSLAGTSYFRDITAGSNKVQSAAKGYDLVTGWGAPLKVFQNKAFTFSKGAGLTGTPLSGTVQSMVLKDNHYYVLRSVSSGSSQVAALSATFTGSVTLSQVIGGTISITGTCGATNTVVYALNPSTNKYDQIGTVNLGLTSTTVALSTSGIGKYINSAGGIQFEIAGTNTSGAQFSLSIDQITFTAGTL